MAGTYQLHLTNYHKKHNIPEADAGEYWVKARQAPPEGLGSSSLWGPA